MLVGVGPICDVDFTVVFTKQNVTVFSPKVKPILTGLREKKLKRLWHFSMKPAEYLIKVHTSTSQTTPAAHSVYDLPSVEALVR